jgi:hypothetical protein
MNDMKRLSTALLAAGLIALAGCGGRPANNTAANVASNDVYDVSPDDLGAGNMVGNEESGNGSAANGSAGANTASNASGNAH